MARQYLYAEFTAREGCDLRVAELLRRFAAEVRAEPGNITFHTHQRRDHLRSFFVYEVYRDDAAFRAHLGAEHGARFNQSLGELIEEDASRLTWLQPV